MGRELIVILGPTAVGKTDYAVSLAQKYGTVVVSCDSRQIYREMRIGTAPPSPEQLAAVRHYFIFSHSVKQRYSAGQYEIEAMQLLEKLFEEHVNSSEKEYWERMGQIWITVNVVCARAVDLSTRMKDLLGEDNLPKRIQTEHTMLPDEAERWILDYRRIVNDHENARYERQKKREEAAPRGRGRPRKTAQ